MASRPRSDSNLPFTTGVSTSNSIAGVQTSPSTYDSSGFDPVLWRFNEIDTTQFGTRVVPCTLNTTPLSSETLSVVDSATEVGKRLRFQYTFSTSSSSTNAGLYPLLIGGSAFTLPRRFIVRIRYRELTLTNVTALRVIFGVWNGNTSSPYGIFVGKSSSGTATECGRIQASDAATVTRPWWISTGVAAGGTWLNATSVDSPGAFSEIKFDLRQGAGGNPFRANAVLQGVAGELTTSVGTAPTTIPSATTAAAAALQSNATTIDAGFNDQVCDQPFLGFIANTGAGTPTADFSISDFEILADPMDY